MRERVNHKLTIDNKQPKKLFNLKIEKLIREANDNFLYFKDYKAALALLDEILKEDDKFTKALILKGHILLCCDNEEQSLKYFKKAIESDIYSAEAYGSMAGTLYILGRIKEAFYYNQKAFENLHKKDKKMIPSLYEQKISMLIQMKKIDEADEMLNKSMKYLTDEDRCYLLSCFKQTIKNKFKERTLKQKKIAEIALKVV